MAKYPIDLAIFVGARARGFPSAWPSSTLATWPSSEVVVVFAKVAKFEKCWPSSDEGGQWPSSVKTSKVAKRSGVARVESGHVAIFRGSKDVMTESADKKVGKG